MPWPRLKPRPAPQNAQSEANLPLNHDVFLVIFSYLGIADILAIRQTCRRLRDLTHERSVWSWRYAAMIEEMQLPRPKEDPNLSTAELESAVKRHQLVESAWYRARPHMQSLRTVAFSVFAYPWLNHLRRVFVAPGGQYLLFITSLGIYILHVDKPPALLAPFIQWSHIDTTPFDMSTCRWVTGKPGDGSVTLFAELRGLG
ncbi:hypothetical protein FRB90_010199 [Tulasnella sp. 427]|nr:hypothetical protein FRB90_010199 [Tulasnella sp. 427]